MSTKGSSQQNLFGNEHDRIKDNHEKQLWDRFIRLGERIGDGDLDASESKYMNKEYGKLMRILIPEIKEADKVKKIAKNKIIDQKIATLIEGQSCIKCAGSFRQSRSGSLIIYCTGCDARFKAVSSKRT